MNRIYQLILEAGKAKSRGARSKEDTQYIFNNLLDDMKKYQKKDDQLFNFKKDKEKNFYDTYITNRQLNSEGIKLVNILEPHIINWLRKQNINILQNNYSDNIIYTISDLINNNNSFLKAYIPTNNFDQYFEDDFKTFIEYTCKYLYNNNSNFKSILIKNIKPSYKVTNEDINTIADNIYSWYKNNFKTIYQNYIFNQSFNLKSFLINTWENKINQIYDLLALNPDMYSSSLKKIIKQAINTAVNTAISIYQFPTEYKINKNADLEKSVLKKIEDNYESILEYVKFPKEKNGAYKHSWLGKIGTRMDAKPIIEYLSINPQFAKQIFNINIKKIEKESGLSWKEFILQAYEDNYNEKFELKIRQYLVEKNIPIHNNNAKKILNNHDKKGQTIQIKNSPRADQNRNAPLILIHSFVDNKDHILIGDPGSNHGSIYNNPKYNDIFNNCYHPNDVNKHYPKLVHVYLLGTLAFIAPTGQEYNGYDNIEQVANILIKDSRINKVYTLPDKSINGFSTRLASLILLTKC